MRESSIEHKVNMWAMSHRVLSFKFTPDGVRGLPDRIFLHNGRVCFIEFKATGGKPTPLQEFYLNMLREEHIDATCCDNYDDAIGFITRTLLTPSIPRASHPYDAHSGVLGAATSTRIREDIYNAGGVVHPPKEETD
jgi:hypothetical protein